LRAQRCYPQLEIGFLAGQADIRLVRNTLAAYFLRSEKKHLILADDDIHFSARDFEALVLSPRAAVCLSFAKREIEATPVEFGLGLARIDLTVFEKLKSVVGAYTAAGETQWDFFEQGPGVVRADREWCSEAFCFWSRVEQCGVAIDFVRDTDIVHYGKVGFRLQRPS